MKNYIIMSLASVLAATAVHATTYTWDGGGTNSNWSTAANWDPDGAAVSAADTTVKLGGTVRLSSVQDLADPFVLNRLEYLTFSYPESSGYISLSGSQIQVVTNGTTQPHFYLTRRSTCRLYNDVNIPAGTTLVLQIGTYGLDLNGLISGEGGIEKTTNNGGITLNHADNTFSGGLTIRAVNNNWSKFNVKQSGAMGTGPVTLYGGSLSTSLTNPGGLIFYGTTTHTNKISLAQTSPVFVDMPNGNSTVTLNGDIDLNTYTLYLRGGGVGTINGVISEGAADAIIKVDPGTWTLGANNTFTGDITINDGTIKLGTSDALDASVALTLSGEGGILDLDGNNQTIASLTGNAGASSVNTLTSSGAATLTVNQTTDTIFVGSLSGALSLVKTGSGSLTLSSHPSTTSGDVTISNGTLVVASGAGFDSADITVASGSLELTTPDALADAASLLIVDGATVTLSGGATETVDKLFLNGAQQARGTYGITGSGAMFIDDTHFAGAGLLYVESNPPVNSVDATWDDEGTDTSVGTAENWVGDAIPVNDGTAHVLFGTAGDTATVDSPLNLYGITFNRDAAFKVAADAGIITNGFGGINAQVPGTSSRTYTITEDMILGDNQSWTVANNGSASTTLSIEGSIDDGFLPCNITKTEFGRVNLTASNSFDGTLTIQAGNVGIYDSDALGSTNGNTFVDASTGGRMVLSGGLNIKEPLLLKGDWNNSGTVNSSSGNNILIGPVSILNQVRLKITGGSLTIKGGVTAPNDSVLFVINSSTTVKFTDKPLYLPNRTFWTDTGGLTILSVTNNTWADTMVATGELRLDVPNALPPSASLRIGVYYGPNGTLNLNGNNQTVSKLYDNTTVQGTRQITSPTPALLTINQDANSTYNGEFNGKLSVLKTGTGTLTFTNAFSSTEGSFIVTNGTLKASNLGTFGNNSTNIVVGGTGSLVLENDSVISDSAILNINESGIVNVNAGLIEKVKYLFIDGVKKPKGTYGATGSGADNIDDTYFAGTGMIEALQDYSGTIIIIR